MRKLLNEELGRLDKDAFHDAEKIPLILILDNVRSHLNVGSIFRTADAFRIERIYLCGITGIPPHRDIQKTALGATETVVWEHRENILQLVEELKSQNVFIASLEQAENSTMLHHFKVPQNKTMALVLGNEVDGVSQDVVSLSDSVIEIPQFGTKHSLNIAVSAGMSVWELAKQYLF